MTVYICENGEQKYAYTDVLTVEHDEGSYIITFKENNEIKRHRYIDRYELRLLTESTIYNFDFNLVERLRHREVRIEELEEKMSLIESRSDLLQSSEERYYN